MIIYKMRHCHYLLIKRTVLLRSMCRSRLCCDQQFEKNSLIFDLNWFFSRFHPFAISSRLDAFPCHQLHGQFFSKCNLRALCLYWTISLAVYLSFVHWIFCDLVSNSATFVSSDQYMARNHFSKLVFEFRVHLIIITTVTSYLRHPWPYVSKCECVDCSEAFVRCSIVFNSSIPNCCLREKRNLTKCSENVTIFWFQNLKYLKCSHSTHCHCWLGEIVSITRCQRERTIRLGFCLKLNVILKRS